MRGSSIESRLEVQVKHRRPAPNRYTWEIHREHDILTVKESSEQFSSWEEASQNGHKMLRKLSAI